MMRGVVAKGQKLSKRARERKILCVYICIYIYTNDALTNAE
jgi:hypothetical protein